MIRFVPPAPDPKLFLLDRPQVKLGDDWLEMGAVVWETPVGTDAGFARFLVDRERSDAWWPPAQGGTEDDVESPFHAGEVSNRPIALQFRIPEIVRGTPRVFNMTWKDLYVMERRIVDRENAMVVCADQRVYWRHAVTGSFNIPQRINDFELLENGDELDIPGQVNLAARFGVAEIRSGRREPDGVIDDIVAKQIRQPIRRYRPWSLKRPLFGVRGLGEDDIERPWRALDIAIALLVGREVYALRRENAAAEPRWTFRAGILRSTEQLAIRGPMEAYSEYAPDRVEWECEPVKEALAEMLQLARAGLYVATNGQVVIYPIDDDDPSDSLRIPGGVKSANKTGEWLEVGSSFLEKLDNRAWRPRSVRCCFPRMHEIDLKASSEFLTAPDDLMINVTPAPAERFIPALNKRVAAGELVKTSLLLNSYQVTEGLVQKYWNMRGELAARIKEANGVARGIADTEIDALVVNLQESYRQLFKIIDEWVDVLKSLAGSLVTVIDSNGKQSPALVFARYPVIPGFRLARELLEDDQSQAAGWNVDATDPAGKSAPFFVIIEDEELGLIRVQPVADNQNGDVYVNIPSGFKEQEMDRLRAHITPDGPDWGNIPLEENWTIRVRVTAEWFDPNDENRLFMIEVPAERIEGKDVEALGPPVEVRFDREPARFDWRGQLVNAEMLKAIAAAEAKRIMFTFRDRWTAGPGGLQFAGGYRITPWGSVSSVSWEWVDGALSTRMQFAERVAEPLTAQLLRKRLAYQLERRPPVQ